MKTERNDGLDRLFAAARAVEPGVSPDVSAVENALETRVLARIREKREKRVPLFYWAWRLAPVFSALVIALGAWYYASVPQTLPVDMHAAFSASYDGNLALNFSNGE